jgi:GNAT superfamily N-acetyltransferase
MLKPATLEHLACIKPLIHAGAAEGSWSSDLAHPGRAADALFSRIGYALLHGRLPQVDPRTNRVIETRIGGAVFVVESASAPVGFGLFKDFADDGFEFWLCAIDASMRGKGLGRQMLTELMATPYGSRAQLARCATGSSGGRCCAHILKSLGFGTCRTTSREEWLLHRRTPAAVVERIVTMDLSPHDAAFNRSAPH